MLKIRIFRQGETPALPVPREGHRRRVLPLQLRGKVINLKTSVPLSKNFSRYLKLGDPAGRP